MERQWHEVLLDNDDGGESFAAGAPLIVEALQIIERTQAVAASVLLAHRLNSLTAAYGNDDEHNPQFLRRAVEPLKGSQEALEPFIEAAAATFAPLWRSFTTTTKAAAAAAARVTASSVNSVREELIIGGRRDGLVAPRGLALKGVLQGHPLSDYQTFCAHYDRLCAILSNGVLFTACEPRIKVLQSRFMLHRAFNAGREDEFHPTYGGGDLKRAPKVDIRRIETCMCASSLVNFINSMSLNEPYYVVETSTPEADSVPVTTASLALSDKHTAASSVSSNVTIQDALDRFFGPNVPRKAQTVSAEALCLRPNYAEDSAGGGWGGETLAAISGAADSRAAQAANLLRHFLSITGGRGNRVSDEEDGGAYANLLARLVVPVVAHTIASGGNGVDRLELEFTVTGCYSGEIMTIAEWCMTSGMYDEDVQDRVQFSLRVSQGDFVLHEGGPGEGSNHNTSSWGDYGEFGRGKPSGESGYCKTMWQLAIEQVLLQDQKVREGSRGNSSKANHVNTKRGTEEEEEEAAIDFSGVLHNIFSPIWKALIGPPDACSALTKFLSRLVSFSVVLEHSADVQELPRDESARNASGRYPVGGAAPPDAYFVYHVWRNLQLINCYTQWYKGVYEAHCAANAKAATSINAHTQEESAEEKEMRKYVERQRTSPTTKAFIKAATSMKASTPPVLHHPLRLRLNGGSRSRGLFTESVLGLLLADEVVNPTYAFEWSPVGYMYFLTQRHVIVTPSRNRNSTSDVKATLAKAIPYIAETGLHGSIATLDPLFYNSSNNAMMLELEDLVKQYGLSTTDVTEMCLSGVEHNGAGLLSFQEWTRLFGRAWPRASGEVNHFSATQVVSLRLHFRDCALAHEMGLVCDVGLPRSRGNSRNDDGEALLGDRDGTVMGIEDGVVSLLGGPDWIDYYGLCASDTAKTSSLSRRHGRSSAALPPSSSSLSSPFAASPSFSSSPLLSRETRRKRLLTSFHTPVGATSHLSSESSSSSITSSSRSSNVRNASVATTTAIGFNRNREVMLRFPRIVISGPDTAAPSAAAKQLARAMVRRHYYRQFAVRSSSSSGLLNDESRRSPGHKTARPTGVATEVLSSLPLPVPQSEKEKKQMSGQARRSSSMRSPFTDALSVPTAFKLKDGVVDVVLDAQQQRSSKTASYFAPLPTWEVFQRDVLWLRLMSNDPDIFKYAKRRLGMLECKYKLHVALTNDDTAPFSVVHSSTGKTMITTATSFQEGIKRDASSSSAAATTTMTHITKGDLYNCVKVDVHCHMAGGVTAKTLLNFMKKKLHESPGDVVGVEAGTGRPITLAELFKDVLMKRHPKPGQPAALVAQQQQQQHQEGEVTRMEPHANNNEMAAIQQLSDSLSIASLDVQAGKKTFHRFDEFNSRYSPMGVSALRSLFLKTDNFMGGRYFAEIIRDTFAQQAAEGNTFSEYRLSIYGRDADEWDKLARWFVLHGMAHSTNRWMVQVPRLFGLYRRTGVLRNFQEMLNHIFAPLWEASVHPEKHPFINHFLTHISGFDSVDSESDREADCILRTMPAQWTVPRNPPFAYYMYFMWANITTLNRYRAAKGLSTFDFRPHAGESGDPDHMADVFLIADGIGHGINLARRPTLQYLYFLSQIPLGIVPLSNNALFCKYSENPFPIFFRRGLNVALATDGALMFHHTEQPLIEEYSTAQNFWDLSSVDMCEIAKNSVLMSGYPAQRKRAWLGPLCQLRSAAGNDVRCSLVPITRCTFRYEVYLEELTYLQSRACVDIPSRAACSPLEEDLVVRSVVGYGREELLRKRFLDLPVATAPVGGIRKAHGAASGSVSGTRPAGVVFVHAKL